MPPRSPSPRGGYLRYRARAWEPAHYAAAWSSENPAPEWWAELDVAWQDDRRELMSVRKLATFLGWSKHETERLLALCADDRERWSPRTDRGQSGDENQTDPQGGPRTTSGQSAKVQRQKARDDGDTSGTNPGQSGDTSGTLACAGARAVPCRSSSDSSSASDSPSLPDPEASEPNPTPDPEPTPDTGSDPDPWAEIEAQVTATREAEIAALAVPTPKPLPRPNRTLPGMKHGPPPRTPHPLPPLLRRDGDRREPPAGSPDAPSGDVGSPTGGDGGAGAPPTPSGDLPPGQGGHAAPAVGAVLGPPVAAGVDDDVSPVRVGDRVLPGDLPALLSGMPSGDRVALAVVKGGCLTTRALLAIRPDQLRYTKGLGGQGADNVVRHLAALGVEPGCLSPEMEDERVWDQCLTGPPPQPGEPTPAYLRPRHLAALSVVGGRTGIRRANQFELNKLREKFLNHCKVAKP